MPPNLLEIFQQELKDCALSARRIQALNLPDLPVHQPIKTAADTVLAVAGLEPLFTKAIDTWLNSQEDCECYGVYDFNERG